MRERETWRDWVLRKWNRQESTERVSSYCTHSLSNGILGRLEF